MRARYLETHYVKETIIECYLNTIAMGHGTYGVEVASNYYFGKSVKDLTLSECACLAAITKSPTYYARTITRRRIKSARDRFVRNVRPGLYNQGRIRKAKAEEVKIVASRDALKETDNNSYFVDALIDQVVKALMDKFGYEKTHANKIFYSSGYKIYATVDANIQKTMESVFSDQKTYGLKGKNGATLQGSMTVIDYNGHVKGLVGGIGEKIGQRGFNRATSAVRQPGSTMKPIAAYAPAIEKDIINYSSIVNDTKTNYNGWTPVNWYSSYWGNITVQYALERSVNTIPVYLVNKLGTQVSFDFLTKTLGITTLTNEDVNLAPLGMGGTNGGITSLESAAAYAIFGNLGQYHAPTLFTKVTDQHDEIVFEYDSSPTMAISEDTATVMNKLLQTVVYGSRGTGAAARNTVKDMKIFAKTGTSNNSNDLWFVGGTPYYVGSCWCGYDEQQNISNAGIARVMWSAVMSKIHNGLEPKEFEVSSYATERYYCTSTGLLATSACPSKSIGWYKKSNTPGSCTAHAGAALKTPAEIKKAEVEMKAAESSKAESTSSSSSSSSASSTSSKTESNR
ncbi:MAG: transglycosylase domain-containing protein [Oscillospiraceae bacterium]